MSTSPVQLDPGSFQPLPGQTAAPAATQDSSGSFRAGSGTPQTVPPDASAGTGTGAQLDSGSFQPLDGSGASTALPGPSTGAATPPSFLQKVKQGVRESFLGALLAPPENADEAAAHAAGGDAGLFAYRAAAGVLNSHAQMQKASKDQFWKAVDDFRNSALDFVSGQSYDAAQHSISGALNAAGAADSTITGPTSEAADISSGATSGQNLTTPLTRGVVDLGTLAASEATKLIPGAGAGAEAAEVAGSAEAPTADSVAMQNAAKSGLPEGAAAQTEAPTVQSTSPQVQQAIRDSANNVAQNEGLQPVPNSTPIRETFNNLRDQFFVRSKAGFQQIQQATGVDLNGLQQDISRLGRKISDAVGEPDRVESLTEQLQAKQAVADQAFADAQKAGIDTRQAVNDWRKMNAADEMNSHVVNSTSGRPGIGSGEVTDPTKLAPRLEKASVSQSPTRPGRLQEFMGDDVSNKLADTVESNRGAIKDFEPTTATGQQAMQDLIRPNTGTGKVAAIKQAIGFTPKTNWIGTYSDLSKLSPAEVTARFGADAGQARSFVASQARWQVGNMVAKGLGVAAIGHVAGIDKALVHLILE